MREFITFFVDNMRMTLLARKFFLTAGAVWSLVLFLVFSGSMVFLWRYTVKVPVSGFTPRILWCLGAAGCVSLFSVVGGFGFRRLFQRTAAMDIFFFLAFVMCLSFDALKGLNYYLRVIHVADFYGTIVTRAVYMGFFMGLLFLFASSLFSGELTYQKTGSLLGIVFVFSLALAYTLPIDGTVFGAELLHRVGGENYIRLVRFALEGLTLLGFVRSAHLAGSPEQWHICGAVALLIPGREIIFFVSSPPLLSMGIALLVLGIVIFSRKIYAKHLWI